MNERGFMTQAGKSSQNMKLYFFWNPVALRALWTKPGDDFVAAIAMESRMDREIRNTGNRASCLGR